MVYKVYIKRGFNMKFSIDRSALLTALQHVHSVVERRNTIPILSNVLIEAKEDGVYLTATDMDIAVIEKINLESLQIYGAQK